MQLKVVLAVWRIVRFVYIEDKYIILRQSISGRRLSLFKIVSAPFEVIYLYSSVSA